MVNLRLVEPATFAKQAVFETIDQIEASGYRVPAGTKTDGATQPRWMIFMALILIWTDLFIVGWVSLVITYLVPAFGRYVVATIVHDHLLTSNNGMSRHDADRAMKKVLEDLGINGFWSDLMYRLVRINSKLFSWKIG